VNRTRFPALLVLVAVLALAGVARAESPAFTPPQPVLLQLRHIEETHRILDQVAEQVWPGWKSYRDVPFRLLFPNGLMVLVGHPSPPEGFELLPGVTVSGKPVVIDRRNMTDLVLRLPLGGGGGIILLGTGTDKRPIRVVDIRLEHTRTTMPFARRMKRHTDSQVLIYIHELFHCIQGEAIHTLRGNLQYNPDAQYAYYSAIEGMALEKAYRERDDTVAKGYLRDFLLARRLKQLATMTEEQRAEEASDDLREGTAVYAEIRTLELLRAGYTPGITSTEDPHYQGFRDVDALLAESLKRLRDAAKDPFEAKFKCYAYGAAQALLLQRWQPGWQKPFATEGRTMDRELASIVEVGDLDESKIAERWRDVYRANALRRRVTRKIQARDAAFEITGSRTGFAYIVSFKPIQLYPPVKSRKTAYRLGLITAYPNGCGSIKRDAISITGLSAPAEIQQLYHLRVVDTAPRGGPPFTVESTGKEGEDVYLNAVIKTPLFTLQAPKVEIREGKNRVKLILLSRV
jgi:hypothetical protein